MKQKTILSKDFILKITLTIKKNYTSLAHNIKGKKYELS